MKNIAEKRLYEQLAAGGAHGVYAAASPDSYLLRRLTERIVAAAPQPCEVLRIDAKTLDLGQLADRRLEAAPLFGGSTAFILNGDTLGELAASDRAQLAELLNGLPPHVLFIVTATTDNRRPALPKELEKLCPPDAAGVVLPRAEGEALEAAVREMARAAGTSIDRAAVRRVAELCGGDLATIRGEIEKAAAYSGYTSIKADLFDRLTARTTDTGVFDIIRAASAGNKAGALTALSELLRAREEPIAIAAALNNNYINYYRALLIKRAGGSLDRFYVAYGYRRNDVKPKIAFERCGSYSIERLERIIGVLCRLDAELKGSRADSRVLLETALSEILMI